MSDLVSVRMRASRKTGTGPTEAEVHVSGAEGLYGRKDIQRTVRRYIERALAHPKGRPDTIVVTIEGVTERPKEIRALPVATADCRSFSQGGKIIAGLLQPLGISRKAVDSALALIGTGNMRGAAIIGRKTGNRLDPDEERGIRVSRLGITQRASRSLSSRLVRRGINTATVKEALILASKVASCEDIIAEVCVSDDPYYTTGYVASQDFGYVRIPCIKRKGSRVGGRAFFVNEDIDIEGARKYLERSPVLVGEAARCRGVISVDEILNRAAEWRKGAGVAHSRLHPSSKGKKGSAWRDR